MSSLGTLHILRSLALSSALMVVLTQCRCIRSCIHFFKNHASTGTPIAVRHGGDPLPYPMRWEQFAEANAQRGIAPEVLRRRFEVADANHDGLLTPEEVERHRGTALRNKMERDGPQAVE